MNKKNIILSFVICILVGLFLIVDSNTYSSDNYEIKNLKGIKLNENITIQQEFKNNRDYSSIGFLASNDGVYINKGYVYVYLMKNDKVITKYKLSANKICDDNYYYKYYYFKYRLKKNTKYTIVIKSNKLSSDILIGKTVKKNSSYYVNSNAKKGSLALSFVKSSVNVFGIWSVCLIALVVLIIVFIKDKKGINKYEKK